ncbi:MAG: methylated-DNA--[protein]-cysteine S-methyltransferase [Actinomycetota bacterium]|nr:methylated-DNA--[protein]-cysteine S-methyltransferase [Actinomycetota bacterium]
MTVPLELDERFRAAAAAEGLVDVAYDTFDSPVGGLLAAIGERGLCRISFDAEPEAELERLAALGTRVLRVARRLDPVRRQLDEYFEGRRRSFDVPVDLTLAREFQRLVLSELVRIPYGETATYGSLARRVGKPQAARAVGRALNRNPVAIVVPCHRVVGADGSLVGYGGGLERKLLLLDLEGADARAPRP